MLSLSKKTDYALIALAYLADANPAPPPPGRSPKPLICPKPS